MRLGSLAPICSLFLLATLPAFANPRQHRGPTAPRLFKPRVSAPRPKVSGIGPERAMQLQTALVKAGYLPAPPSGVWDTASQEAMQKLQADNGWQTKLVPDARAIIKLGLGPGSTPAAAEPVEIESNASTR